jgi:AcrR family transcriptional regulator
MWAEMAGEVIAAVEDAFAGPGTWRDRMRAAAYAALDWLQVDSSRARFFLIEALSGGEMIQARRDVMMNEFVDVLDAGRQELPDPEAVSRSTAEALAGAIYENLIATMKRQGTDAFDELLREMMYLAVLIYFGPQTAREELRLPRPSRDP